VPFIAIYSELLVATLAGMGADVLRYTLIYVVCLVLAVSVHEFSHAYAAHKLGDPTAEGQGRLTLNPVSHADPIGTLALPVILGLSSGGTLTFGWGRPVPFNPRFFTRKVTMRAGSAIVAFAGPLSNLVMAAVTLGIVYVLAHVGSMGGWLAGGTHNAFWMFFSLNVLLFVFNLLPFHPLDGGKVLGWLLGPRHQNVDDFLTRYGFIIVIGLMVTGLLERLFSPVILLAARLFAMALG
jgi:Zn-dependent protease